MCEAALLSVNKSRMEHLAAQKNKKAAAVLRIMENPENFLSSIQIGITLIGIISGVYGGRVLADDLTVLFNGLGWNSDSVPEISLAIVVALITYFSIVVGELVPKSFAISHADRISLITVPFMKIFTTVTFPIVKLLASSTSFLSKLLGIKTRKEEKLSEEELKFMLRKAATQGILEKDESKVHQKLFSFSDQVAKSLMTHRTELEWLDANSSVQEILKEIKESGHSKFPVGEDSLDNLLGIVSAKDFLENHTEEGFNIRSLIRKPIILNEYTPAFNILSEFRKRKEYAAIVVDEHGEIDGMITLHDIIEGVVGSLPDEDDNEDPDIVKRSERSYLINGKTLIFDINDYFGFEIIEDEPRNYTTLSGFFLYKLGEIPRVGNRIASEGIAMEIVDMDGKRIDKILFEILDSEILEESGNRN